MSDPARSFGFDRIAQGRGPLGVRAGVVALALLGGGAAAHAQIVSVTALASPTHIEDFESFSTGSVLASVFVVSIPVPVSGTARLEAQGASSIVGVRIAPGPGLDMISIDLRGQCSVRGFAGSSSTAPNLIRFYDRAGVLIAGGSQTIFPSTSGGMNPFAFESMVSALGTFTPIGSVELEGPDTAFDDLQVMICAADIDCNGKLDIFDFLAYISLYLSGSSGADCDGDGTLTLFDFLCFQQTFSAGC
jgi:hypothetical protein